MTTSKRIQSSPLREEIVGGIARAFFVSTWADREEEAGRTRGWAGQDLYKIAPRTSSHALKAARKAAAEVERLNGKTIDALYEQAIATPGRHTPGHSEPDHFGSDLGLQMMGHGVSWFDDHPKFPMKLPHFEYYGG